MDSQGPHPDDASGVRVALRRRNGTGQSQDLGIAEDAMSV